MQIGQRKEFLKLTFRPAALRQSEHRNFGFACFICRKIVVLPIITLLLVSDTSFPASYYLIGISFLKEGGAEGTGALVY